MDKPTKALEKAARAICVAAGEDPDEHIDGGQATNFQDYGPRWQAVRASEGQLGIRDYCAMAEAAFDRERLAEGREHLTVTGKFQSDKYPWAAAGFVPLKTTDPLARDLLYIYAERRRAIDEGFATDLMDALDATDGSRWNDISSLPDDDTVVVARTADDRVMVWRAPILRAGMDPRTPEHLKFPAVLWRPATKEEALTGAVIERSRP
jgi:hypothetical protein